MNGLVWLPFKRPQDTPTSRKLGWWPFSYQVVQELLPRSCGVAHSLRAVYLVLPKS